MQTHGYEWSDWAKEQQAIGRAEGRAVGRAEGQAIGRVEGRTEGRAEGVIAILSARGLLVPPRVRDRVLAIRDLAALDRLVHRALTVSSAEELLVE